MATKRLAEKLGEPHTRGSAEMVRCDTLRTARIFLVMSCLQTSVFVDRMKTGFVKRTVTSEVEGGLSDLSEAEEQFFSLH